MLRVALLYSLMLTALAERVADDWIDPFDMLNHEPSTRARESVEVRISWLTQQTGMYVAFCVSVMENASV